MSLWTGVGDGHVNPVPLTLPLRCDVTMHPGAVTPHFHFYGYSTQDRGTLHGVPGMA